MRMTRVFGSLAVVMLLALPAAAAEKPAPAPFSHEDLSRMLEELGGQLQGLGERWRGLFGPAEATGERPLITMMLNRREELGLSAAQVQELERLRGEFQREAIKRDADLRVAEMDLAAALKAEPVDVGKAEAKVRDIERLRADLRVGRIRVIEQGKAVLTSEQRAKLATLLSEPWPPRPRSAPSAPPRRF